MTRAAERQTGVLEGVRVVELADEQAAHAGLLLAGMGAAVVKVEPASGSATRRIGPFVDGDERSSVFFFQHNLGKRSAVLDPGDAAQKQSLLALLARTDVLLLSGADADLLAGHDDLTDERLREQFPRLIVARVTPFGQDGPWADFKGGDLVHLALGGPAMNCGYDPQPDGFYDLPPIAPAAWQSYVIAGEQLVIGLLAAVVHQRRTGQGQIITSAVHEAVAKSTELDLMNWVMRRSPLNRQTCRHAAEKVSAVPTIAQTKDGRWLVTMPMGAKNEAQIVAFLQSQGMSVDFGEDTSAETGRSIPGSSAVSDRTSRLTEFVARFVRKHTYDSLPWLEAQEAGVVCSPLRKPHENALDEHWQARGSFAEVDHPELGRALTYAVSKWVSTEPDWVVGRRAPLLGEDTDAVLAELATPAPAVTAPRAPALPAVPLSPLGKPFPLAGVRIFDFSWFLASAGGTRFLTALGAECIKVEWKANPDTRIAAMSPVGGRAARDAATGPLPGVTDPDMGGQFNNKNPGKRGLSLNVRHPEGLDIARRLVAVSDIVAEGFSPGVMDRWGLGYETLRELKPDVIYAQQSGMGTAGTYGRLRAVGPVAAALSGVSELSGLPEPAMPAGWGYSYLDWIGAYSFAAAMLGALIYRDRTGLGQWVDASQTESGLYVTGGATVEWSVTGEPWTRTGNRSPNRSAAPHGIYRCAGDDRWIAIACSTDAEWDALTKHIDEPWTSSADVSTLAARLANQDALDARLSAWTQSQEPYALMERLQAEGVPAGVCQTAADRCDTDPQLAHLGWLTEVTGTKIGRWPVAEVPFRLSETPGYAGGAIDRGAPGYGEDNEWVLGELLGMNTAQISKLAEDGVI